MPEVLVLGGGICGLGAAMMLARDGHEVTVVEQDPSPPDGSVEEVIERWDRPGVRQFNLGHFMQARFRHVLETELPDVLQALRDEGGLTFSLVDAALPLTISDRSARPGDEMFSTVTGRRQMLELVFARAAEREPNVRIMRGRSVEGLLAGADALPGIPHVVGARIGSDEIRADIVVDALGRKSTTPEWLRDLGGRPPVEEVEDSGFAYYGRYFRSRDGTLPAIIGPPLSPLGSISILSLPADNATWTVVVFTSTGDTPMKQLRFEDKWRKVVAASPLHAHWLDGDPAGGFEIMSGVLDRYRRFVVDGKPVATGILPVADAWASTNPSLGRGVALGIWHAQRLRDHVRGLDGDHSDFVLRWDEVTESELTPWYRGTIALDRARFAEIEALREGREPPDPRADLFKMGLTAASTDADMFRAFIEVMSCLATPEDVFSRPGIAEKFEAATRDGPLEIPGPDRAKLLELVA